MIWRSIPGRWCYTKSELNFKPIRQNMPIFVAPICHSYRLFHSWVAPILGGVLSPENHSLCRTALFRYIFSSMICFNIIHSMYISDFVSSIGRYSRLAPSSSAVATEWCIFLPVHPVVWNTAINSTLPAWIHAWDVHTRASDYSNLAKAMKFCHVSSIRLTSNIRFEEWKNGRARRMPINM